MGTGIAAFIFFLLCIFVGLYWLSKTEYGPFTQLPTGCRLAVKSGTGTITRHYLNQRGYGIRQDGTIYEDKTDRYFNNLFRSFLLRTFGVVSTGPIPVINGVKGAWEQESSLKYSENKETGDVTPKVVFMPAVYSVAPQIFLKRAVVLGGIPIKGHNLVKVGISYTIRVTNVEQYEYRVGNVGDMIGDTLESAIRQAVEDKDLNEVLELRSEKGRGDTAEGLQTITAVLKVVNDTLEEFIYGAEISDINIPYISPVGKYAEAERQTAINEAKKKADKVEVDREFYRTEQEGIAVAGAVENLVRASGNSQQAWKIKAYGALQPGVVFVEGGSGGSNVLPTIPLPTTAAPGKREEGEKPQETKKK